MKISDLIKELETIKDAEGDLPVVLSHWDSYRGESKIESLDHEARYVNAEEISAFSRDEIREGRTVVFF